MSWKRAISLTLCAALLVVPIAFAQDAPDASMEQAKRLYRNGDFRGALSELQNVVDLDPGRADALYLIGYSHVMLREYADAVDAFSRAFVAEPSFDPRTIYQRPPADEATAPGE